MSTPTELIVLLLWPLVGIGAAVAVRRVLCKSKASDARKKTIVRVATLLFALYTLPYLGELVLRVRYGWFGAHPFQREGRQVPFLVQRDGPSWRPDPLLGWSMAPNRTAQLFGYDSISRFRINADGYRGLSDVAPVKQKSRLLVLGDSFSFGHGVQDGEEWPQVLGTLLPDWEVINVSANGYSEVQLLQALRHRLQGVSPDVVILGHFRGMLERNASIGTVTFKGKVNYRPFAESVGGSLRVRPPIAPTTYEPESFMEESYLYNYLNRNVLARRIAAAQRRIKPRQTTDELRQLLGALLIEMRDEAYKAGAKGFVVVYLPSTKAARSQGSYLQEVCARIHVPYRNLSPRFYEERSRPSSEPLFFANNAHPNKQGHRLIATEVARFLRQEGLLDARPTSAAETTTGRTGLSRGGIDHAGR